MKNPSDAASKDRTTVGSLAASPGVDDRRLLPLFLRLAGRRVVLVGGGKVAAAKLGPLVDTGAEVTVIAPEIRPEIAREGVRLQRRPFAPSDLEGAWLAVAAAPAEVNRQVAAAAEAHRIFVNAVDDPLSGTAYTGGVLRRGGATIAISTEGRAPALAGLLREALELLIPEEVEAWIVEARRLRAEWRARAEPMHRRRPLLLQALNQLYADREALR
jgi:uroporphyrin-III C-methyltransferase/precorrin-2 dehydrogenase/sirohydrochlorin ferrochelatase